MCSETIPPNEAPPIAVWHLLFGATHQMIDYEDSIATVVLSD